jgi:hypothetical protein
MSSKKPGRKAKHYVAADGSQVYGLARDAKSGRWRIIGTSKFFTEPDEQRAIEKFRKLTNPDADKPPGWIGHQSGNRGRLHFHSEEQLWEHVAR